MEIKFSGEQQKKSFGELLKRRVCMRCALRMVGFRDVYPYRNTSYKEFVGQNFDAQMTALGLQYDDSAHGYFGDKDEPTHACHVCLGILQHCDKEPFPTKLVEALLKTQYEHSDYKLKVKLPYVLTLLEYHVLPSTTRIGCLRRGHRLPGAVQLHAPGREAHRSCQGHI